MIRFLAACILLFIGNSLFCQKNNSVVFERYVQNALQQWKTPGMSIVVVKDGKVVYKNGFGVTELGKPNPIHYFHAFYMCFYNKSYDGSLYGHAG